MSQIKTSSGVAIVYNIQFTNPAIQQFLDVQGTTICKRPKTFQHKLMLLNLQVQKEYIIDRQKQMLSIDTEKSFNKS